VGDACRHRNARLWCEMPFDVKSDRDTDFGKLYWCPDCRLGFVDPLPEEEQIGAHYDLAAYYTQGGSHMPRVSPGILDRVITKAAWTFDHAENIPPLPDVLAGSARSGRALDIGCGNGKMLADLAARGFETVGVEPDPKAREVARQKGSEVHDGTAEHLPAEIAGQTFDVVVMTHVLEHCRVPDAALKNARDMLADGGVLYVEVPNCGSVYFQTHTQISEMLDIPRHLHFFTQDSLRDLCERVGLRPTDWRFQGYTPHFGAPWRAWENSIYERLKARGRAGGARPRTYWNSLQLVARTAFTSPARKYDSIGFFAGKV